MPATHSNQLQPIDTIIAAAHFPRLFNATLRRSGWSDLFIDEDSRIITATLNSHEQTMGKRWEYRFSLHATWRVVSGYVEHLVISISEANHAWSQQLCASRFCILLRAFAEDYTQYLVEQPSTGTTRGARFSTLEELCAGGYLADSLNPTELLVAPGTTAGSIIRVPTHLTNRHAIVCGPTGTGKTTGIFIPNLIQRTGSSAIVTEATGGNGIADLYTKTAGFRAAAGHRIFYFNPDDLQSHCINPLDQVSTYRQARRACEVIFQSTTLRTHRGDQSWEMAERQLLTALILHATSQRESGRCHFGYVNELLDGGAHSLNQAFNDSPLAEARRSFFRFTKTCTEGYRNLVINGLMTRLDAWNAPRIKAMTQTTTVNFDDLTDNLFTLYLAVPADNAELKPLMALMLNYILDTVQRRRFKHPLMLMLDEFTNFGAVRNLPAKLTILRHDGIPAVLGVQDYVQLENMYDRDAKLLISQPATRIFFKPNDLDTAQKLSQMIGDTTHQTTRLTSSGQLQEKERKEPLLSPGDLLNLTLPNQPPDAPRCPSLLVFLPDCHPIHVPAFTWQAQADQANSTNYPPPAIPPIQVDESLTLMPGNSTSADGSAATQSSDIEMEKSPDKEFPPIKIENF